MSTQDTVERSNLRQDTLDLLILGMLIFGSPHRKAVACAVPETREEELLAERGALYPALQRLEGRGWISLKWEFLPATARPSRGF
jgi:PadR family transcriptional regulator PadR